jgi:hypothetical protein
LRQRPLQNLVTGHQKSPNFDPHDVNQLIAAARVFTKLGAGTFPPIQL